MSNGRTFPAGWPTGCPPSDAQEASGTVYRLLKTDQPTCGDFETWFEKGQQPQYPNPTALCQACAVSVSSSIEDLRQRMARQPDVWKHIAVGVLDAGCGVMKPTPCKQDRFHCSWWCFEDVVRHGRFTVIPG